MTDKDKPLSEKIVNYKRGDLIDTHFRFFQEKDVSQTFKDILEEIDRRFIHNFANDVILDEVKGIIQRKVGKELSGGIQ